MTLLPYFPGRHQSLAVHPFLPSDSDIKAAVVNLLRVNPFTRDHYIRVDVAQRVVVLGGEVLSSMAKQSAGEDAWTTPGVVDVSNQLTVRDEDGYERSGS
jgi:osmotically-inducible protein OsmY